MGNGIDRLLKWIEEQRNKISLVDYINEECSLIRIGDTYIGYCPFDNDSKDSYLDRHLLVDKYNYYCLSCGESGDIIDYIMKTKNLTFEESLHELATITDSSVPDIEGGIDSVIKQNSHKERLYALMKDAALHYFNNLKDPRAKIAVDYLEKRGFNNVISVSEDGRKTIGNETVRNFALGFSLDFDSLVNALKLKGYTVDEMKECGLVYEKNGKPYDVMYGRLMFPIINRYNKVIAFSGRIFEDKGFSKYKNTSDTVLFNKKNELYGAYNLRNFASDGKLPEVYIVEGYMDVIAMFRAGIKNVVASMGTALTEEQAGVLADYTDTVYLSYDGDNAGQKATRKGVDIMYNAGITPRVISLIEELDPDEIIKKYGVDKFIDLKKESRNIIEYKIDDLASNYNLDEAGDKGEYAVKAIEIIAEYAGKVDGEEYLGRVSDKTGLSIDVLRGQLYNSTVERRNVRDNAANSAKDKDTYTRAVIYILYMMLTGRKSMNIAYYMTDGESRIAYDYLRLTGSGADMEEFGSIVDNEIAKAVTKLKGMSADDITKLGNDSYRKVSMERIKAISERLFKEFSVTDNDESRYLINENIRLASKIMSKIKLSQQRR